jgi:hypothetical protein
LLFLSVGFFTLVVCQSCSSLLGLADLYAHAGMVLHTC